MESGPFRVLRAQTLGRRLRQLRMPSIEILSQLLIENAGADLK